MNFFLCPDTNYAFFQLKNIHGQVWKNSLIWPKLQRIMV